MTNDFTAKRGFVGKGAVWLLLTLGAVLLALVVMGSKPQPAQAFLCVTQKEEGDWVNVDPNTRGITRIELRNFCTASPPWRVRVWHRCKGGGPDCQVYWGEREARKLSSGFIYAVYDFNWGAKLHVWAKRSTARPGQLWVQQKWVYSDPNRPNDVRQDWFKCVSRCART